jgi:Fe-S-cluster containining protein
MSELPIDSSPFPPSPVTPETLDGDAKLQFRCRKGIACWNACCSNIDIALTPVDIVRLKQRLGVASWEFLRDYTVPYEMEKDGIAGVKLKPVEGGTACRFMNPEGCSVYEDRPTACRYYPVALLSMRRQDEVVDRQYYAIVREAGAS